MLATRWHSLLLTLFILSCHWTQCVKCHAIPGDGTEPNMSFYIENFCGIPLTYESHHDDKLRNFCRDSFKLDKSQRNMFLKSEPSEDQKKCYSLLCAWHQETCHVIGTKDLLQGDDKQKCQCLHSYWQHCNCDNVLNGKVQDVVSQIHPADDQIHKFPIDVRFGEKTAKKTNGLHENYEGYQGDSADVGQVKTRMASDDSDSFIFVDEETGGIQTSANPFSAESYSDDEIRCFAIKQAWFNNQCVKLKSEESCGAGEWLVLKENGEKLQPVCEQKKCIEKDEVWWAAESGCMKKSEVTKKYCKGKDVLVENDSFGNGHCTCYDEAGSFEGSKDCYEFYQRGPCRADQVVTYDETTGNAVCSKDLCFDLNHPSDKSRPRRSNEGIHSVRNHYGENDGIISKLIDPYIADDLDEQFVKYDRITRQTNKRKQDLGKKFYAPFHGNGQCYKLGPLDMCKEIDESSLYKIHKILKIPDCILPNALVLHLVEGSPVCKVDQNHKCRTEVKLPQVSGAAYLNHLKNKLDKPRGK